MVIHLRLPISPGTVTLSEDNVGTRYVFLTIRTFMEPNDEKDMNAAYRLQDAVGVEQADTGELAPICSLLPFARITILIIS